MPKKPNQRLILSSFLILVAIPLTIAFGVVFLQDRKYYFISAVVLIDTMLPFLLVFEHRKPKAREIILICSLSAIAVVGRIVFFMLPQFKPVTAVVIVSAVCLGPEAGFLVGAMSGFVSNFFFGQGPWTPWQMFGFGIIGFLAGVLFRKGMLKPQKAALCIFGGLATFFIYGGLMNFASVLMYSTAINREALAATYLTGIPFDLIHASSTVIFLFFIEKPMSEKVARIRLKYGLINENEELNS